MPKRRRWTWLVAAVLLFAAAAWLMTRGEPDEKPEQAQMVAIPKRLNDKEYQRMSARRTLPEPPTAPRVSDEPPPPPRPRDPLLAALPAKPGKTTVVVEANALSNSPIGELLLACARRGERDPIAEIRKDTGVDPLQDLDRVAVSGKTVLLSGQFGAAKWDKISESATRSSYGEQGTIYRDKPASPEGRATYLARWGDQMMLLGESEEELQAAIDRIEGRAPATDPAIDESSTYGEVYGVIGNDFLDDVLGKEQPQLAAQLKEVAQNVELHVSAMGDVGLTARVGGQDKEKVTDLAKSLGAALSLARLKAQADGDPKLAELLDYARVSPGGKNFSVELALPMAFLEKHLAFCREPYVPPAAAAAAGAGADAGQ
ncbi:MAG TPA: hypothetical protein VGK67_04290 [Myxococcales bacterium]|jgi:hypothetical protein